jgi:hypothetical protein
LSSAKKDTRQNIDFSSVILLTLGKGAVLSSVNVWRSAKLTTVSYRRLLTTFCRGSHFAKTLTLGKSFYAESFTLGKRGRCQESYFTESSTRQRMLC